MCNARKEKNNGPKACWTSTLTSPLKLKERERIDLVWILTGKHLVWYDLVKI